VENSVVLFGASGLIGRAIHRELQLCEYPVISLRSTRSKPIAGLLPAAIPIDFHNTSQCREIFMKFRPKIIISTPWITSLTDYRTSPLNLQFKNSTISLAKLAIEFGASHFIGFGSSAEYGDSNLKCDASNSVVNPLDLYSKAKYETYLELSRLFSKSDTKFNWLRVFQPFGENQDPQRLIPYLVSNLSVGHVPILREPNRISDWVSSTDIGAATIFAMRKILPEILDIGSTVGTSNSDLANLLIDTLGVGVPLFETSTSTKVSPGLVVSKSSPIFAAGWKPITNLQTALSVMYGPVDA
jgi:nucleoside-diphosphate-sugar epimerase